MENKTEQKQKNCACPHCGSTDFNVVESVSWKGSTDENSPNIINLKNTNSEIDLIECKHCSEDITDFITENFELNFD